MHADRTNRVVLILLALALIGAGGVVVATSFGAFGAATEHGRLTHNRIGEFIGRNGDWFWPVAGVVALIVVLLSLRWLLAVLFSTDRIGDLDIAGGGGAGRTTVDPHAVADAVAAELDGLAGVDSVRARMIGTEDDPELVVTAAVPETADLVELTDRIIGGALTHARTALGRPDLPIQLDLTVTEIVTPRVL